MYYVYYLVRPSKGKGTGSLHYVPNYWAYSGFMGGPSESYFFAGPPTYAECGEMP